MFRRSAAFVRSLSLRQAYLGATGLSVGCVGLSIVNARSYADQKKSGNPDVPIPSVTPVPFKPTVYQYEICPFCSRVKTYLDFCGVEYESIEVDPLFKTEIRKLQTANKKVPIVIINGQTVEDSGKIIEVITQMGLNKEIEGFPGADFFPTDTEEWSVWSEKKLAVYLYPNISRNLEESWECFSYAENVPTWGFFQQKLVRLAGTGAMTAVNGKIKTKYHIVDERKELKETIQVWTDALKGQKFLHGDKVTMPDVMVFGVLKAIKGLRTFNEAMAENAALKTWYDNVEAAIPTKKTA